MSEDVKFLSFADARNLVAAIQEEENIREPDKRVLTAYNHENIEI